MRATVEMVYGTAGLVTAAGIGTLLVGGKERMIAGAFVSIGMAAPWLVILQLQLHHLIMESQSLFLLGLFAGAPLFLWALFGYLFAHGIGEKNGRKPVAAAWAMGGVFAAALNSLSMFDLLCQME